MHQPDADEQLRRMSERESSSSDGLVCGEGDDVCLDSSSSSDEPVMHQQPSVLMKEGYDDGAPTTFASVKNLLPMAAVICILISFLVWILYRHLKQQSEWQQASELQLKQISQRNNIQPEQVVEERKTKFTDTQTNVVTLKSTHTSATIINSCKGTSDPVLDNEQVQRIREQQQKHHETKTKLAKQLKRQAEKEKKRMLYDSLQHQVADKAYARRKKLISEEQATLLDNTPNPQHSSLWEPQPINELEEMERRELLHMQNIEYEESLRQDQQRSLQAKIEADKCLKRARAMQYAIHRLENAGVHTQLIYRSCHKRKQQQKEKMMMIRFKCD